MLSEKQKLIIRNHLENKYLIENIKVASCSIVKMENRYIREFIIHQEKLCFNKVFIYDHNEGLEDLNDVIGDYIESGFVEVIDWSGHKMGPAVMEAFQDCWDNHRKEYDWMVFCDIDEFLTLKYDNCVQKYLNRSIFNNVNIIKVNWKCFNDNDLLYYNNMPLEKRFVKCCGKLPEYFIDNRHIKCIINCKTEGIDYIHGGAHCPCRFKEPSKNYVKGETHYNDDIIVSDECGRLLNFENQRKESKINYISYNLAYFKHFRMKTIEEYVMNKRAKLNNYGYTNVDFNLELFFKYNSFSEEKYQLYHKLMNNFQK